MPRKKQSQSSAEYGVGPRADRTEELASLPTQKTGPTSEEIQQRGLVFDPIDGKWTTKEALNARWERRVADGPGCPEPMRLPVNTGSRVTSAPISEAEQHDIERGKHLREALSGHKLVPLAGCWACACGNVFLNAGRSRAAAERALERHRQIVADLIANRQVPD